MYYSTQTTAALIIGTVLSFVIPIGAVIVYKLKNRSAWFPSALVGVGTFILFAMILEQLVHALMFPIVKDNAVLYIVYGALAAGIFEETGRFVAYKTIMKNNFSAKNAVMMGLGHGGIEVILILGMTMISLAGSAIMVNSQGLESVVALLAAENPDAVEPTRAQLEALTTYGFTNMAMSIYERLLAMTLHVCMSVVVFFAAARPGKIHFFPIAIVIHALFDTPAAMYQAGVITSLPVVYAIMTVLTACPAGCTVMLAKKYPDYPE